MWAARYLAGHLAGTDGGAPRTVTEAVRLIAPLISEHGSRAHGEVVPRSWGIWHSSKVQFRATIHDDEKWLRGFLGRLTKRLEAGQPRPWKMGDAPQDYLRQMLGGIVGIEIPISRLVGRWKVSQNRSPVDREGAAAGLRATGESGAVAMADLIVETANRAKVPR